ncbi:hypothetical protein [Marinoscillum sp.]|uniref:hypothetical protein n=1 Tax=Marinoscillum sp. TaxID=2024838 RepID=UPI003BAB94C1
MKKLGYLCIIVLGLAFSSCYDSAEEILDIPMATTPDGGGEDDDDPIPPPPEGGGVLNGGDRSQ